MTAWRIRSANLEGFIILQAVLPHFVQQRGSGNPQQVGGPALVTGGMPKNNGKVTPFRSLERVGYQLGRRHDDSAERADVEIGPIQIKDQAVEST
jgi:hypothetical protein